MKKPIFFLVSVFFCFVVGTYFFVEYRVASSTGIQKNTQTIEIEKGKNALEIGDTLARLGIIERKEYFVYHIWKQDLRGEIVAGKYQLGGSMTIPEIAKRITRGEIVSKDVTVTFPEGWTVRKMAERLTANGLPGERFLGFALRPEPKWREEFAFLQGLPKDASLEGFLFPDTYTFTKETSAESIVEEMLSNFEKKVVNKYDADTNPTKKSLFDTVIMASIVEREVNSTEDRKMVADLFWRRLDIGMPLQSDATVQYVRGENKVQHSYEETRVDSPYNTYVNKGLPPGPINSPSLDAIAATLDPIVNDAWYFLSDTTTGETVFSKTFEEHKINKTKHGL